MWTPSVLSKRKMTLTTFPVPRRSLASAARLSRRRRRNYVQSMLRRQGFKKCCNIEHTPVWVGAYSYHLYAGSGCYNTDPRRVSPSITSLTEFSIHFWRKGPAVTNAMHHLDYLAATCLTTTYPPCKNQVTNVLRLSAYDAVPSPIHIDSSSPGRHPVFRPEQKIQEAMKFVVSKSSKRGEYVRYTLLERLRMERNVFYC